MYIYIYIYMFQYIFNHENNVASRLSPESFCRKSCTWGHDVHHVHHVPKCLSCQKDFLVITGRAPCFHDSTYILRPSRFCEI